eukprot:m51a1_g8588 hypothetical protein (274) ;mRNA; f:60183-62623
MSASSGSDTAGPAAAAHLDAQLRTAWLLRNHVLRRVHDSDVGALALALPAALAYPCCCPENSNGHLTSSDYLLRELLRASICATLLRAACSTGSVHVLAVLETAPFAPLAMDIAEGSVALAQACCSGNVDAYYLRRAHSYQFVLGVLRSHFPVTVEELAGMRRLREAGPVDKPLVAELEQMVELFQGLHDVVMHELGFPRPEDRVSDAPEAAARRWLGDICEDEDLLVDNRMMVPAHYDANTGRYKVWCILGFATCSLEANSSRVRAHFVFWI